MTAQDVGGRRATVADAGNGAGVRSVGARVVVVGGGITGLTTAHRLLTAAPDLRVTVLEAGDRAGGKVVTDHVDGFVLDGGPDSLLTSRPHAVDLARELGLGEELVPADRLAAGTSLVRRGRLRPLPDGLMGLLPKDPWPVMRSSLLTPAGRARLACEYLVRPREDDADESVRAFVTRRLGAQAYDRIAEPLVSGVLATDPSEASVLATMRHLRSVEQAHGGLAKAVLAQRRAARDASGATSSRATSPPAATPPPPLLTPTGGMGALVDALLVALAVAGADVRTGSPVTAVQRRGGGYRVEHAGGSVDADAVVLAVPAGVAADAVTDLGADLAGALRTTTYGSTAVVSLGYRAHEVRDAVRGHGYLVPASEGRLARACTWTSAKLPGRAPVGHALVRVSLGGPGRPDLDAFTDADLVERARAELRSPAGVTADPLLARVHRWSGVMPQYHVGHLDRVAEATCRVAAHPGLHLAGSAWHGVGLSDCVASATRTAGAVLAGLVRR
ncbi:protoporphyrinogen oxidase [Thalassiella azotivora]